MQDIVYGIQGEGLGHVNRAFTIIKHLNNCRVHVFTYGNAYDFLKNEKYPYLNKIESVNFHYFKNGKVNYIKTFNDFIDFYLNIDYLTENVQNIIKNINPKLIINDFDPIISRIDLGIPIVSLDNQHKFVYCNFKSIGIKNQIYVSLMRFFIKRFIKTSKKYIVSTFCFDDIKNSKKDVELVNVIIKDGLKYIKIKNNGFLLVYCKDAIKVKIIDSILDSKFKYHVVKVYGNHIDGYPDNIVFNKISQSNFIDDLATCSAVFTTCGNQLLGECRYLGKPIFAVPIPGQPEQILNACYVDKLGFGKTFTMNEINGQAIESFMNNKWLIKPCRENGLDRSLEILRKFL